MFSSMSGPAPVRRQYTGILLASPRHFEAKPGIFPSYALVIPVHNVVKLVIPPCSLVL